MKGFLLDVNALIALLWGLALRHEGRLATLDRGIEAIAPPRRSVRRT